MKKIGMICVVLMVAILALWVWSYIYPHAFYVIDSEHYYWIGRGAILYREYDMGSAPIEFSTLFFLLVFLTGIFLWPWRRKKYEGFPVEMDTSIRAKDVEEAKK